MKRLLDLIKNKFFLVTVAFVIWMVFFDKNDVFSQYEYRQQLNKLKQEQGFYKTETEKVKNDLNELSSDKAKLEKFAREKYLMKKDNEDVFVILHDKKK
ncbi:septum formation initiator family protein [Mucilaginibacter sp. 21P]|uniref:FtsB family cell division protein n=1 Tax=Mucilaginibacter sp. 21P TaxID=2778902 RepID=UPI001C58EFE6|nr:septum formation initiator family protein [Mucilaginibacter sp. 21P]QXV65324.1 septum formation initiator family protein [Mucilaginibacter sp. 21P]